MHYHQLIVIVIGVNLAMWGYGMTHGRWWASPSAALQATALVAQANLTVAVVLRQQHVVNLLFWLATRAPLTWPLRVRWALAKVYHAGGVHVGAAVSAALWYLVFVVSMTRQALHGQGGTTTWIAAVSYAVAALFIVMIVMAVPQVRARYHDTFEATHRFCGWAAVVLVWVSTVPLATSDRGGASVVTALLTSPSVCLLAMATIAIALPWLTLRKVPVTIERPSSHVAVVHVDDRPTPFIGSVRSISRHPLLGWHAFATIPAPARRPGGYRMAVSRAGDWTARFIDDPPTHVWRRGTPVAGMANIRTLFKKVVYVTTGSGIGPTLGHLMVNDVPARLVWVTRDPGRTYGQPLVDEILAVQPHATIWNTDQHGKPDILRLAYAAYSSFGAEAVICIANKTVTWQVVHGLERLGIPACGPIWDS
jgi:hypothetical protein